MATIRIITVNLLNGAASPAVLRRLIRTERPDVVCAQELAPNAARVLADELPFGRLDPRLDFNGTGLALRYEARVERFPLEHHDGLRAVLQPEVWPNAARPIEIITVHIANPLLRPIRRSLEMRRVQTDQILEHLGEERRPRILVGDLNATPIWPLYRRITDVMTDAARMVGTPQRTWAPWWWMPRLLRIDHALVEGLVPTRVRTRRVRRSDHSALIVDVESD